MDPHLNHSQALPNGHISPALFVALRVLCAPEAEARSWSSIGDALRLPAAANGAGAAAMQGAADGSDGEEEQEEEGQPELGAVQVWPVLSEDGQPLDAGTAGSAGSAGGAVRPSRTSRSVGSTASAAAVPAAPVSPPCCWLPTSAA